MQAIKKLLSNLDILSPIETGIEPQFAKDTNIKSLIFNIYGTLFVAASGNIEDAVFSTENLKKALSAENIKLNLEKDEEAVILKTMLRNFTATIDCFHCLKKAQDIQFPEIDLVDVCQTVLFDAIENDWIESKAYNCKEIVFMFELLCNKVSPMPKMKDVLKKLHHASYPLGIVSNAQFYTPMILNYFVNEKFEERENVPPFDADLSVFSYKELRGKPDVYLYEKLIPVLASKYKLKTEQVAVVGNDMLKDIHPAQKAGFKTILFAGDKRSLRMCKTDKRTKKLKPDYVITALEQLLQIVDCEV